MDKMNEIIKIEGLRKRFGDNEVLKGITTSVRKGEVVAIIGPSGCGKSTFLRSINLLEEPTEGIKCTYGKDNIEQQFDNFCNLIQTGRFTSFDSKLSKEDEEQHRNTLTINNIITTCLGAKNAAYSYENETRGVIYCNDNKRVQFRTRNGYIIPYIEVSLPKKALKGIVIGPTNNTYLKEQSILHFLQINGYNLEDIQLVKSNIPYRG